MKLTSHFTSPLLLVRAGRRVRICVFHCVTCFSLYPPTGGSAQSNPPPFLVCFKSHQDINYSCSSCSGNKQSASVKKPQDLSRGVRCLMSRQLLFLPAVRSLTRCVCGLSFPQEEYRAEGITWHNIDYIDNSGCLNLISKKPTALFHLLDEECKYVIAAAPARSIA